MCKGSNLNVHITYHHVYLVVIDDGKYKVLGNTSSHTTSINCKTIEDAVFLPSGLCFIEDGKIKIMNYETCDISQMDSAHRFIKMSMIESEEKVYAITGKQPRWLSVKQ